MDNNEINSLLIEMVDNGYIVYENENPHRMEPNTSRRKVFESTSSLNKYITDNMSLK